MPANDRHSTDSARAHEARYVLSQRMLTSCKMQCDMRMKHAVWTLNATLCMKGARHDTRPCRRRIAHLDVMFHERLFAVEPLQQDLARRCDRLRRPHMQDAELYELAAEHAQAVLSLRVHAGTPRRRVLELLIRQEEVVDQSVGLTPSAGHCARGSSGSEVAGKVPSCGRAEPPSCSGPGWGTLLPTPDASSQHGAPLVVRNAADAAAMVQDAAALGDRGAGARRSSRLRALKGCAECRCADRTADAKEYYARPP